MLVYVLLLLSLLNCEIWEIAALASGVFFHELGHLLMLLALGVPIHELAWGQTGAVISCAPFTRRRDELLSGLAGPLGGLIWAFAASRLPLPHASYAASVSLALSAFNLLPIPAMDGGRIARSLGLPEGLIRYCGLVCLAALLLFALLGRSWYSFFLLLCLLQDCIRS